ncbi:hypothetical protein B0F90DRAFT_1669103 [Multifurca ochricompacta]|uniref:Uncharacterized protein n=1 Tax=Multifurca ochricompacta TaxID=376703 RepID=A0AAD4M1X8_9AGAM|nr:hypothetical protein B0F90DRAFT_1669103 [Multifurca ochricompacta]
MSFFPRSSYLGLYGGELHRKGGVLLKARLKEWERELQYLRFRIAEWKEFGSVEHPDYYPFRTFLLQKVRNHLYFELKIHHPSIHPPTDPPRRSRRSSWRAKSRIFAFRERISPGEITRRIHVEEWHRYCRTKEEVTDTPSQMDDMFARIRNEIGAMERRSGDFKRMVDELVGLVDEMQERERMGGFVNGLARSPRNRATRSNLVHSSSDLPSTLSDTRTRLPPTPSLPLSGSATTPESPSRPLNARPTPTSGSSSSSLLRRAASSQSVTAGSSIALRAHHHLRGLHAIPIDDCSTECFTFPVHRVAPFHVCLVPLARLHRRGRMSLQHLERIFKPGL